MTAVAVLAGASALTLSFVALFTARIGDALRLCMLQAPAAAVAAMAQGWARHDAALGVATVLALALNGVALPLAVRRLIGRASAPASIGSECRPAASAAAGIVLTAAALAGAMRLSAGGQSDMLAVGLAVLLLGLLLPAVRSHRLLPALGLLSSQNGAVLAAGAIPALPASLLLLAALPLVPALVVAGVWLHERDRPAATPRWA
jgi:hydrogenase-4 membrane subunit HyfE